ncbi:NIF family HAD-type phosphatase [Bacteroidota bacterium]
MLNFSKPKILALDLEGTLITDRITIVPRPGLYEFLEYCKSKFERIVMMTSVPLEYFLQTREHLLEIEAVPKWFIKVPYINYADFEESEFGEFKDLRCIPESKVDEILIIDDMEWFIRNEQNQQWISITPFKGNQDDNELIKIMKYFDYLFE